jgi:chromosome segregation ATPase
LKEKEQYEKVRKEADAESGELKRAKIDTDRKRIYYHNYEGTLEKKRADLQHEQRLYQKERTIFDNKKKFLENETVDMEKYKIDLEKREQ